MSLRQAWLVGYLEGEAWFGFTHGQAVISVHSSNKEPIEKTVQAFNAVPFTGRERYDRPTTAKGPYKTSGSLGRKPRWYANLRGLRALHLAIGLFPAMSQHRKDQINQMLYRWEHGDPVV